MYETSFGENQMSNELGKKSILSFKLILSRKSVINLQTNIQKVEKCI